jgi:hypothetical protein
LKAKLARFDLPDAAVVTGIGLTVGGVALIYAPAALIVLSLLLVLLALSSGGMPDGRPE